MPKAPAPRISLVIPAFNEEKLLPRLLETVRVARERFRHGASAIEVIVADNGSTDRTREIALEHRCRAVPVAIRNIGAVRNGGARQARGEILCFVDADARIHPDVFTGVDDCLSTGRYVVGATGVTPERWSVGILATFLVMYPLLWATHIDTGLIFCLRSDFGAVGGYDERRAAAEDVMFHWAMMRHGTRSRPRRRGVRLTQLKGVASMRKFDEYGDWHYFTMLGSALPMLWRPAALSTRLRRYWYPEKR